MTNGQNGFSFVFLWHHFFQVHIRQKFEKFEKSKSAKFTCVNCALHGIVVELQPIGWGFLGYLSLKKVYSLNFDSNCPLVTKIRDIKMQNLTKLLKRWPIKAFRNSQNSFEKDQN